MEPRLLEIQNALMKPYNYTRKKLYPLFKELSEDEKELVCSHADVLERFCKVEDDEILGMLFRMSPEKIQEAIWEQEDCQRRLLCIRNLDIQDTKTLNEKVYFSKERIRRIDIFVSEIKSSTILNELCHNIYFQIIVLFAKGLSRKTLEKVDCLALYENTIASGVYNLASNPHRQRWTSLLNGFFEEVKLPSDFHTIYKTTKKAGYYYTTEDDTIIPMLRGKNYHLQERGQYLSISKETLARLNMEEMIFLYNLSASYDVANSSSTAIIGKNEIEKYFKEIIDEQIIAGTIFTSGFLKLNLISHPFQYFAFSTIILASQNNKELENRFITFLRNYLFKEEYTLEEQEGIYTYIKNGLLATPKEVLAELFTNPSDIKSVFHLRFNRTSLHMNYLSDIGMHTILKLNVKQINKLVKLLEDKTQDEISDTYSKAIRLYLIFGLDRATAILRGDYGKVGKAFLDCVSKLNVQNVPLVLNGKKYEPVLNQELLTFLFKGENILKLFEVGSIFETTWFHLINSFDEIKEMCKGHVTLKQAEVILKEKTNRVKYELEPDLYSLEDYLYEIGLGNKVHKKNEEVYDEVVKVYREQLKRTKATIPYVEGTLENGYSYKVMRLDDPIAYVLGYRADCCIRILDIAHKHLLHALHCVNGRILLTYKPNGVLASFSPLKRNGELLIANSIEMIGDKSDIEVAHAFQAGIETIVKETQSSENQGIRVACIGHESYMKPEGRPWPNTIPTPTILEKREELYSRTDIYHKKLDILYQDSRCDLNTIQYGEVEAIYKDPRLPIQSLKITSEISIEKRNLEKVIHSIHYQMKKKDKQSQKNYFVSSSLNWMEYAFYNRDWYILIDKNGKFYYECIEENPEALKEMKATLAVISELKHKKDLDTYVLSFKREVK